MARNFERPFTPRTSLRSPRNFGKSRFRRFATFDFLTPEKFFFGKFFHFFFGFCDFRLILKELGFFDVKTSLAPPKSAENCEKPLSEINFFFQKKKFGVKKSKVANRPKSVLPKFRADPSHVRRVRGRLGGIREA